MCEVPEDEVATEESEHHYDTDDELGLDGWYTRRGGVCRGEAEEVLGRQWSQRDPVAWAINTSSGQEYLDPSTTEKECRHSSTVETAEEDKPHLTQWMWTDGWWEDDFVRSSSSTARPSGYTVSKNTPHSEWVESGEGWLSPTDEAAGPKHHSMHTAEIKPMSAARMRAANKAAVWREWSAALRVQWEEQRGILKLMWEEAFDSQKPENQWIYDYRKRVDDGMPGIDAVAVSFWPYEKFQGSWDGWVLKAGHKGLGNYQDGCCCDQGDAEAVVEDSLGMIAPVVLKLDGLIPDLQRVGDPLEATMQDDKVKEQRNKIRKHKAGETRAAKVEKADEWLVEEAIKGNGCSHRDYGLWAVETANPNAWSGAKAHLNSSAADFIAVQETKVDGDTEGDAENTARNLGRSASVSPCVQGAGGGKSAGVAVACRQHIGVSTSCEEEDLPKSLQGRFAVRHIGAMCRGGFRLASGYLHNSLGITHKHNMDWLQDASVVLKTLHGPWILAADFNAHRF